MLSLKEGGIGSHSECVVETPEDYHLRTHYDYTGGHGSEQTCTLESDDGASIASSDIYYATGQLDSPKSSTSEAF